MRKERPTPTSTPYSHKRETITLFESFVAKNKSILRKMSFSVEIACKHRICADDVFQELQINAWYAASRPDALQPGRGHSYLMRSAKNRARDIIDEYKGGIHKLTSSLSAQHTGEKKSNALQDEGKYQEGNTHNGTWPA